MNIIGALFKISYMFTKNNKVIVCLNLIYYIMKTHVRGFFDTDLHEVSWHFATHEAVRPSGF